MAISDKKNFVMANPNTGSSDQTNHVIKRHSGEFLFVRRDNPENFAGRPTYFLRAEDGWEGHVLVEEITLSWMNQGKNS